MKTIIILSFLFGMLAGLVACRLVCKIGSAGVLYIKDNTEGPNCRMQIMKDFEDIENKQIITFRVEHY